MLNHGWPAFPIALIFLGLASGWTLTMVNSLGTTIHSRDGRYIFNMLYFAQNLGVVLGTALVGFVYSTSVTLLFAIAFTIRLFYGGGGDVLSRTSRDAPPRGCADTGESSHCTA